MWQLRKEIFYLSLLLTSDLMTNYLHNFFLDIAFFLIYVVKTAMLYNNFVSSLNVIIKNYQLIWLLMMAFKHRQIHCLHLQIFPSYFQGCLLVKYLQIVLKD